MAGQVSPSTVAAIGMIDALAQLLHAVLALAGSLAKVLPGHARAAWRPRQAFMRAMLRVGHRLGAGHTDAARRDLLKIWRSATGLACLIALVVLPLAARYARDPEVVRSAATLIAPNCLFMPCWGVAGVWLGMFGDWACRGGLFWRRTAGSACTRPHPMHWKHEGTHPWRGAPGERTIVETPIHCS